MAILSSSASLLCLGSDLLEEIMNRLPPESVSKLKVTCRELYDIVSNVDFVFKHHDLWRKEKFARLVEETLEEQRIQFLNPERLSISYKPYPDKCRRLKGFWIQKMVHCDGLLLCSFLGISFKNPKIGVLNPVSGSFISIPSQTYFSRFDSFGIGYAIRGNYKILRLAGLVSNTRHLLEQNRCEIFVDNSWKRITSTFRGVRASEGLSQMGFMFWITKKAGFRAVISFDFTRERFRILCRCPTQGNDVLSSFQADRLSVLHQEETTRAIHIWLTRPLTVRRNKFVQFFVVSSQGIPRLLPTLAFFINRHTIVACSEFFDFGNAEYKREVALYKISASQVRRQLVTESFNSIDDIHPPRTCAYVFVPSLVTFPRPAGRQPTPVPDLGDLMKLDNSAIVPVNEPTTPSGPPLPVLVPGLKISAQLSRRDGKVFYNMLFENNTQVVLDGFTIEFNKNAFGLAAAGPLQIPPLQPGTSSRTMLPMVLFRSKCTGPPSSLLQVAVKYNKQAVSYFIDKIVLHVLFIEDGKIDRGTFFKKWRSLPDEVQKYFPGITMRSVESTIELLSASNMFSIAKCKDKDQDVIYLFARGPRDIAFWIRLAAMVGQPGLKWTVKTQTPEFAPLFFEALEFLFKA